MNSYENHLEHILTLNKIRLALLNKVSKRNYCYDLNFGVDTLNYLLYKIKFNNFVTYTIRSINDNIPKLPDSRTKYINVNGNLDNLFLDNSLLVCMNTFNSVYINTNFITKIFTVVSQRNLNMIGCIYDIDLIDELLENKNVYNSNNMKIFKKDPIFKISFPSNLCVGNLVENYAKPIQKKDLVNTANNVDLHIEFFKAADLLENASSQSLNIRLYFYVHSKTSNNL